MIVSTTFKQSWEIKATTKRCNGKRCSETFSKILERGPSKIFLTKKHLNKPSIAYTPNFTKHKFFHMFFNNFAKILKNISLSIEDFRNTTKHRIL